MEVAGEVLLTRTRKKLKASVINPKDISHHELVRMHHLFLHYYEGHPFDIFKRDLLEKDDVILLRDEKSLELQGFSTIMKVVINKGKKQYHGIYSGDTVVANDYWGSPALGIMFLKYLWWHKIKNPFRPLYWFLISKGYKTYLMMANNFTIHYPRFEFPTEAHHQELMDAFYSKKFKNTYTGEKNLIIPVGETCHLKAEVADIDRSLLKIQRIKFFQEKNPDWQIGHELCCISEMSLFMPLKYAVKKAVKGLIK
jgi:hypothetical protein